ncbi:MAG: Tim44 domain-containing protein [Dokdonella sp.]|nr:MAG: Tim44 domain-containing protein [Dokdonella sp.]
MKKLLMTISACLFGFGLAIGEAEAKRLGGGQSTGMQRESVTQRQASPAPNAAPPTAAAAQPAAATPKRSWLGPLAGLAAGIGLAALFSHFGLGEELASFLMIMLLIFAAVVVFKLLFRRKATTEPIQYAGASGSGGMAPTSFDMRTGVGGGEPTAERGGRLASEHSGRSGNVPMGFDSEGFLRVAKLNFVRLQAANDAGNLADLREFVSPEMFAEIRLQLEERGNVSQQTDVVTLNAELLEVTTEGNRHIASVRFSGMIREEAGAPAASFDEVWNLTKAVDGDKGWVVAGIQQLS